MVAITVKWFHTEMGDPGEKRLWMTLQECNYNPKLIYNLDRFKCSHSQIYKLSGCSNGFLLEHEGQIAPWEEVALDWTIKVN